ncbi:MAG: T9SS type A sorting domain-containing protein, partial [Candidatus Krumholzibacteria bacterium]|nr:T9SS type A sorting domain-containing protein [Candidatus Krumholzibacteria bacterium]
DSSAVDRRSPAGVYFLRVKGAGETFSRKIVIVR